MPALRRQVRAPLVQQALVQQVLAQKVQAPVQQALVQQAQQALVQQALVRPVRAQAFVHAGSKPDSANPTTTPKQNRPVSSFLVP